MAADDGLRRARSLILEFGWNATAYQILNPGIALWFAANADGVVGYVRHGRTLVVAGAPVCALDRLDVIAAEFEAYAREKGLRVCYFGAGDRLETRYAHRPGWSRVLLGAQPVWDPREWPALVAKRASLRAQFSRARNKGVKVREWLSQEAENNRALRRCLADWLATRGLPPLHFLVEPETLSRLEGRRVFVAERAGEVLAFTVLSPVPAREGWLVEQIVRGRRAPNGTAELLIDFAVRSVGAANATYATLGLSPLSQRAAAPQPHQPVWLRVVLEWVRLHGSRFYNFRGLEAFKAKFNPQYWEPIYAISEGKSFPPTALYAIAGAFSGGHPTRLVFRALLKAVIVELVAIARRFRLIPARRS